MDESKQKKTKLLLKQMTMMVEEMEMNGEDILDDEIKKLSLLGMLDLNIDDGSKIEDV